MITTQTAPRTEKGNLTINDILKHRDTAGHGYYSFKPQYSHLQDNIPPKYNQMEYEEDCDFAIPLFFNFHLLDFRSKRIVLNSIFRWNVDVYESTGRTASRRLSEMKDRKLLFKENKGKYYSVVGYGDWCFDVPKNKVYRGFIMNNGTEDRQGETVYILLTKEENDNLPLFVTEEFINERRYTRDETFYTWDTYTQTTGKERYK